MPPDLAPLGVGISLHANWDALEWVEPLLDMVDFVEISPEITWGVPPSGELVFTGFADTVEEIVKARGLPIVAHGLGLSPGTVSSHPDDAALLQRWLPMVARSQERYGFLWYLEHLGFAWHGGRMAVLPLPLPRHPAVTAAVAARMRALAAINPYPGYENSVWYFSLCDPREEPDLHRELLHGSGGWLLLDLHNAHTHCRNFGLDWRAFVDAFPLDRVLALHVSGGSPSDAGWLKSGRTLWLDGHDTPVLDVVWEMLEHALPRCPNARGIVVERMEGTFQPEDVPAMAEEIRRARDLWERTRDARAAKVRPLELPAPPAHDPAAVESLQAAILDAMHRPRSWETLQERAAPAFIRHADPDGVRISALLVQKLRFERLMRGNAAIADAFEADPEAFVERFEAYARDVPPTMYFPAEEARAWAAAANAGR